MHRVQLCSFDNEMLPLVLVCDFRLKETLFLTVNSEISSECGGSYYSVVQNVKYVSRFLQKHIFSTPSLLLFIKQK